MPTDYRTAHLDIEARDNARLDAVELAEELADRAGTDPYYLTGGYGTDLDEA